MPRVVLSGVGTEIRQQTSLAPSLGGMGVKRGLVVVIFIRNLPAQEI